MLRSDFLLAGMAMVGVAVALSGCGKITDSAGRSASAPPAEHASHADHDHSGHAHEAADDHADHDHDAEPGEYAEVLAKLPDADRAIAEKQKVCPVSGQPLGSMGVPYKVTVKDRDVLLCCEGCKDAILDDPDTYLAKLDKE